MSRGGAPDEICTNVFNIYLYNCTYPKVRIYSLHRTSLNTTPSAYIVADVKTNYSNHIKYTDNNRNVTAIDPTILFYLGCEYFIPKTIAIKDNTLFLGNYTIPKIDVSRIRYDVEFKKKSPIPISIEGQLSLSQKDISFLKTNENYSIILQYLNSWGKPIGYSGELSITNTNKIEIDGKNFLAYYPEITVKTEDLDPLIAGIRVLIHYPEGSERKVITQGIVNPTVFNLRDRLTDSPYSQASWFFRPEGYGLSFIHGHPLGMWKHKREGSFFNELDLFEHPSYEDFDLSNYEDFRDDTLHSQMLSLIHI